MDQRQRLWGGAASTAKRKKQISLNMNVITSRVEMYDLCKKWVRVISALCEGPSVCCPCEEGHIKDLNTMR